MNKYHDTNQLRGDKGYISVVIVGKPQQAFRQLDLSHRQSRAERNGFSHTRLYPCLLQFLYNSGPPCLGKRAAHRGPGLPTPPEASLHKQVRSPTQGRQSLTECLFPGGFKLHYIDIVNCLIPPLKVVSENLKKHHSCPLKNDLLNKAQLCLRSQDSSGSKVSSLSHDMMLDPSQSPVQRRDHLSPPHAACTPGVSGG